MPSAELLARSPARTAERRRPAPTPRPGLLTATELLWIAIANALVVVALWWRGGGISGVHDLATGLTSAGRITGLLGTFLVLVQLLLLARIPALERTIGFDRLTIWHRWNGRLSISLLVAHAGLITGGYAGRDRLGIPGEVGRLLTTMPGMLTATLGLWMLIAVVATSIVIVRRKLRYETWYFVHLYSYLAIALAFSHQLATGRDFVGDPVATAYWYALYAATVGALLVFRVAIPLARAAWHDLRVASVVEEAPGVISLHLRGRHLDRLGARAGQFFLFRFLTPGRWWEAHPFSLSAAPDGRMLRITVKDLGDYTKRMRGIRPGTRVIAEGPYGTFTSAQRRRRRAVLIAGGVGITPIRALLEEMRPGRGEITLLYRAMHPREILFRDELDVLAQERGARVHYVIGDHRDPSARHLFTASHLRHLVPHIADADVYLCGPPAMATATERSLRAAGVARNQIVTEQFAF